MPFVANIHLLAMSKGYQVKGYLSKTILSTNFFTVPYWQAAGKQPVNWYAIITTMISYVHSNADMELVPYDEVSNPFTFS